ncbi:hypothetical protein [Fluviispira multicolorata]|uniref:Lipoprotein n=1 Tax=Fluviispira multicolorata TaxID=2654512 RepID=A0A833N591_9BACT|nr:hypothetical protein [Fluviispira multicolorata]KAB8033577.1 hypothetical protein GCL57_02390 [Fluviispira multicolorata]
MRNYYRLTLYILMIFIAVVGCDNSKSSKSKSNSNDLFELALAPLELADRKRNFLETNSLIHPRGLQSRFNNLNDMELNDGSTCPSPRVATYDYPNAGQEAYCIKIPMEFRNNIPNEIKQEIISHELNTLDLYFIAQHKYQTYDAPRVDVFRVHNWVFPHIPSTFSGSIFNRNILMTVYSNSNILLSNQIIEKELKPFNVNIHDNLISPNNAHTAIASAPHINFSFYSLVIDSHTKRAVVTLHWMIEPSDFLMDNTRNPANYMHSLQHINGSTHSPTSLRTLIEILKRHPHFNSTTEPMRSLEKLLQ